MLVNTERYISATVGALRELGHNDLTEADVRVQVEAILTDGELNAVGERLKDNIVK